MRSTIIVTQNIST